MTKNELRTIKHHIKQEMGSMKIEIKALQAAIDRGMGDTGRLND